MARIFDIQQPRQLIRCKSTEIVLTPTLINLGNVSATDTLAQYFASTNQLINHTAEMIIRVKTVDPVAAFPGVGITFIAGFVFPDKQCQAINDATDQFYAIKGITRAGLNSFSFGMRRHGTNDNAVMNGILDTDFTSVGVEIRMQVTNRTVVWSFRKTGGALWLASSSFAATPDKPAGPTAYPSCDTEGKGTPAGGRFRWNGSDPRSGGTNKPKLETLIPMFNIKTACNLDILSIASGETPNINVPLQP